MKKKIVSLALAVCLIAIAAVGTLAYFTDKDAETNTFTVGNVDIDLIESRLHRVNAGATTEGRLSIANPVFEGTAENTPDAVNGGWNGSYFSDAQIQADARNYSEYLAKQGENMYPGKNVMKCPYVINTGKNPCYVRVNVTIPTALDDGIIGGSMYTSTALENGWTMTYAKDNDGNSVYSFVCANPLQPGAMTFWNVWGDIKLGEDVTNADIAALIESGALTRDGMFNVVVTADAIQADGFADAAAAFTAFDAANK